MNTKLFLGAHSSEERGEAAIIGVPFEGTSSFRPGSGLGPTAIREGSHSLETFGPFYDRDLSNMDYVDLGDLHLIPGDFNEMIAEVMKKVEEVLQRNMHPILLGGEHTITIGAVKSMLQKYPELMILQLDAHAERKNSQSSGVVTHACVMQHITELIKPERVYSLGVRSGSRREFEEHNINLPLAFNGTVEGVTILLNSIPKDKPLYVTLDMDVFDPSLAPGVGNPAMLGMTYIEFAHLARGLVWNRLVGFDVVELAPKYDPTGISAVVAASAVRDLMMCLM